LVCILFFDTAFLGSLDGLQWRRLWPVSSA
jgi:hypothetical protein